MNMKAKTILLIVIALLIFISSSCAISEMSWATKENTTDYVRELVGLPSVAIGNLNPASRNPGVEVFCTSLLDMPGGYCYYFTSGETFNDFNRTVSITGGRWK